MAQSVRPPIVQDYKDTNQRQTRTAIKQLNQPGVQKNTVKGVKLTTGTTNVPHNLGRAPIAWQVVDKTGAGDVWRNGSATADTIPLQASATVTVDLIFW